MISLDPTLRRLVTFLSLPLVAAAVFVLARHIVLSAGDDVAATDVAITEGTNFAVAASPDGRMLVIDLLGSLWTVAAGGGAATRITDELLEARQPSFSPRGDRIAFQGFEDGWDLWSIKTDGSDARRLTSGPFDDREPHWSHGGTRMAFSSERSGQYDIWILDIGSGELRRLTTDPAEDVAPAWSPDDREIAFVSNRSPSGVWAIDVETGAERLVAPVTGMANAPSWTPDGKQVLYNVVADGAARLELSGTPIANEDVFPFRAQWLSDTEFLYTADGQVRRRNVREGAVHHIPFKAIVALRRAAYTRKRRNFDSGAARRAVGIVRPVVSPNGRRIVFAALGDLWVMEIGSRPVRLTADPFLDTEPSWSHDGERVVFSTDRAGNMDLWIRDMRTGRDRRLTDGPAAEMGGTWSPDGRRVAFVSMGPGYLVDIHVVDADTGAVTVLQQRIPTASFPTWSADGRFVLVSTASRVSSRFSDGLNRLALIPVAGDVPRFLPVLPQSSVVDSRVGDGPAWSPDGRTIAFVHEGLLRLLDVDSNGNPTSEPRAVTNELAHAPSWTADAKRMLYLATDGLKMLSIGDGRTESIPLELVFTPSMPTGKVVVHAGRLWNGRDRLLQLDRDVVIEGHRIRSVEPHRAELHTERIVDASASTIIPGMVDMHSHVYAEYGEALGRLLLAYGVTTIRDPGSTPYRSLEFREAWDAGVRFGPRFFTSGAPIDGRRVYFPQFYAVSSPAQLEMELERNRRLGHDHFKIYVRLGNSMQKRVVEFAHQHGMPVASHEIYPAAVFGLDGVEHVGGSNRRGYAKVSATGRTYGDVIELMVRSGMTFTPTLVNDNSMGFDLIPLEDQSMLADDRVRLLMPGWALQTARTRVERLRESGAQLRATTLARHGQTVMTFARRGVPIVAGTDAPNIPQGVGMHAELALYVKSGLTPFEALQAATINAAEALGVGEHLGSIEAGKLADLVIVDGDPLRDVRNARNVRMVMKNGQLFDVKDLLGGAGRALASAER